MSMFSGSLQMTDLSALLGTVGGKGGTGGPSKGCPRAQLEAPLHKGASG
jgi:hypothetical protein